MDLSQIASGWELGALCVNAWNGAFATQNPDITLEVYYSGRQIDIVHEGIDVAIRAGRLPDSDLKARRLGEIDCGLFACPSYFSQKAPIRHPDDLAYHDLIMLAARGRPRWNLVSGVPEIEINGPCRIAVNSNVAGRDIVRAGLGVSLLPKRDASHFVAKGELKLTLPNWSGAPVPVHALYAPDRYLAPKVRAFIDHAAAAFSGSATASAASHVRSA